MSFRGSRAAPCPLALWAVSCLTLALAGCTGVLGIDPEAGAVPVAAASPERAAAIAEMRAEAEAGDAMPFPDAYQTEQTVRLAARREPLTLSAVQAYEAELTLIAEKRSVTSDPHEIAALDARARELRRLALLQGTQLR